jgi:hypothetical protein
MGIVERWSTHFRRHRRWPEAVLPVIRDVLELRQVGVVCRRTDELEIPVGAWRAAMRRAGGREGARIRTFLVPSLVAEGDDPRDQLVYAVRTDPPPNAAAPRKGLLWWRLVNELGMPFPTWRAAMRRLARRARVRVHIFLVSAAGAGPANESPKQLVYAVWADAPIEPAIPVTVPTPRRRQGVQPVTDLAEYATRRSSRSRSATSRSSGGDRHSARRRWTGEAHP